MYFDNIQKIINYFLLIRTELQFQIFIVMDASLIAKNGQGIIRKKLGSCHGNMGKNIRRKGTHTIKNMIRGK